ncbi:hypothetical protein JAAARDRAFT_31650 [Jaapia argillacea MUCL 33604]|uniref:Phospholipid scramblase n=1 Tax=Jaapia argillacea MUCL 33604 TaxID=933084 RepID=A0A067Q3C4_9AGAM|nr:hypothetical protein JAAARDRAFT_31650 [Jaapia argillacea MUCL 33604]
MLALSSARISARICRNPQFLSRTYALSRFPDKTPGGTRARNPPKRAAPRPEPVQEFEAKPSSEESPLWEETMRPPSSDPEEGLRRLLMNNDSLVITREIEMMNIFLGFEQSNRYVITNEAEERLGYIAEEPRGILSTMSRQVLRTHRPFRAVVMDAHGSPVLWLRRPFAFINSRMFVQRLKDFNAYTPKGEPILDTFAEVQQRWHMWRRRYDLFLRDSPHRILSSPSTPQPEPSTDQFSQFAKIDDGLLAWHFTLRDARGEGIAHVNRAFRGFGREIFTDTGQYFVKFGPQPVIADPEKALNDRPKSYVVRDLNLEERALVLAMSVNIDFDYFSRHSEGGHGGMFFWGGGE